MILIPVKLYHMRLCLGMILRQVIKWTKTLVVYIFTVLPAKSNSGVMFSLQRNQGLVIYRSLVYKSYPQDSINTQVIVPFALAQVQCTS